MRHYKGSPGRSVKNWSCDSSTCFRRRESGIGYCRFLPSKLSNGELDEAEKWRCNSRTAACACLLLLCAARESLAHPADSLHYIGALTDVCDALGRSTGRDSMVWGCDLDPGNWAAQRPQPGGLLPHSHAMTCQERDHLEGQNPQSGWPTGSCVMVVM